MNEMVDFLKRWKEVLDVVILFVIATIILCYTTKNTSEPLVNNDYYSTEAYLRQEIKAMNPHSPDYRSKLCSLFELWDKNLREDKTNLILLTESLKRNVSIWIGLIAAICTILPIVLTISQNRQFANELEEIKKEKRKMFKELEKLNTDSDFLSIASKFRVLAEIQDFEGQEIVYLSNPDMTKRLLKAICNKLVDCQKKYENLIKDKDFKLSITVEDIFLSLSMMKKLLQNNKTFFEGHYLVRSLQIQDKIKKQIKANAENDQVNIVAEIGILSDFGQQIKNLFIEQIEYKEENKEIKV